MTLYKLDEWEYNGRDDSDWYAIVYDSEKDVLERVQTGTTRFANALNSGPPMEKPTDEIRIRTKEILAEMIFNSLKEREKREVLEPDELKPNQRVKLLEKHRSQIKDYDLVDCYKCNGTGNWVNPRNNKDIRLCFACKGEGKKKTNFRKRKDESGKIVWQKLEAGLCGAVLASKAYGHFYRNGYNKPGRFNTSAIVRFDDGREARVPLEKLRLEREMASDKTLRARAKDYAEGENYYSFFRTAGLRL